MKSYSPFSILVDALQDFLKGLPADVDFHYQAWTPGAAPTRFLFDSSGTDIGAAFHRTRAAIMALDGESPFVVDPEGGVRETVRLSVERGKPYLEVVNALGAREHVTRWPAVSGFDDAYQGWCDCRRGSDDLDEPWDVARRERRVVDYGGALTLIDPGAVLAVDLVTAAGCETYHSCEGHPRGAYLQFGGDATTRKHVANVFGDMGWRIEHDLDRTTVRMAPADTTRERDRIWRRTCDLLSFYAPEQSQGMRM